MDHVPLPSRAFWPDNLEPYPPVPCVCEAISDGPGAGQFYDGGDFGTYPTRVGAQWKHLVLSSTSTVEAFQRRTQIEEFRPSSERPLLAKLLQSWLFFGLLHVMLNPMGLYQECDFCDITDGKITIHTRHLQARLEAWQSGIANLPRPTRDAIAHSLFASFQVFVRAHPLLNDRAFKAKEDVPHRLIFKQIRMSACCLFETLQCCAAAALANVIPPNSWLTTDLDVNLDYLDHARLQRLGWCPSLIRHESTFANLTYHLLWFYLHLGQPRVGFDHAQCTEQECRFAHNEPGTSQLPHVSKDCTCEPVGPDLAALAACLDTGTFPVFRVHGETVDTVSLEIRPRTADTSYVALSHIWADGMGNPDATMLLRCQLKQLKRFTESFGWLNGHRPGSDKGYLYVWCDTLLVPVNSRPPAGATADEIAAFHSQPDVVETRRVKRLALGGMKDVYAQATYVLILDRMLQACLIANTDLCREFGVRLFLSRWNSRLWNLQEGALPAVLVVALADLTGNVDGMMSTLFNRFSAAGGDPLGKAIDSRIYTRLMRIRLRHLWRPESGAVNLDHLIYSIRNRGVSCVEDEALVLGALLGLDGPKIAARDTLAERMMVLWQLFAERPGGLQTEIIFHNARRLNLAGFRWAPLSLRTIPGGRPVLHFGQGSGQTAILSPWGLHCTYPGWRLEESTCARSMGWPAAARKDATHPRLECLAFARCSNTGQWHQLYCLSSDAELDVQGGFIPLMAESPRQDWFAIFKRTEPITPLREASAPTCLLGYMEVAADEALAFRTHAVASVTIANAEMLESARLGAVMSHRWRSFRIARKLVYWTKLLLQVLQAHQYSERARERPPHTCLVLVVALQARAYWTQAWRRELDRRLSKLTSNLADHIRDFAIRGYLIVKEEYPTDHEWLLD